MDRQLKCSLILKCLSFFKYTFKPYYKHSLTSNFHCFCGFHQTLKFSPKQSSKFSMQKMSEPQSSTVNKHLIFHQSTRVKIKG